MFVLMEIVLCKKAGYLCRISLASRQHKRNATQAATPAML